MKTKLFFLLFIVFSSLSHSQVVINEIDADTPGANTMQIIELKTVAPFFSLNGYVLVFFNGTTGIGVSSYQVIDLDGFTTDLNGNYLIGNIDVNPSPNTLITNGFMQTGPDTIALYLGNASDFPIGTSATAMNLQSAVAYSTSGSSSPTTMMGIFGLTTCYVDVQPVGSISKSIQRKTDGTYEVKAPTPGANNDGSGIPINYFTTSMIADNFIESQSFTLNFTTTQNVTSDLNFSILLSEYNFTNADFTGNLNLTIPTGSNSTSTIITLVDDSNDEGDEETHIVISALPVEYVKNNDNIYLRIYDNDFTISSFGTPTNPTYGQVSSTAPIGYYASLEGLSGAALKQALQDIIANPSVVHAHNYGDIWEILKSADQNPLNSNQIFMLYTEAPRAKIDAQGTSGAAGTWNREHIFPQSRGGFQDATSSNADGISVWLPSSASDIATGHADAHHIRAEDSPENTLRSNRNYGVDYNGPVGNTGAWKGDVARSLFYMAVRYNGLNIVNGNPDEYIPSSTSIGSGNIGDLATFLAWNVSDPKDDFEMNRNNYVQTWQHNRNPFIDYPLLADYIFGAQYGQPWFAALASESFDISEVKVFPNPAVEHIFISGLLGTSKVEIFSVSGAKVFEKNINEDQMIPIDFETGMYFVKISNDDKQIVKKIIVK